MVRSAARPDKSRKSAIFTSTKSGHPQATSKPRRVFFFGYIPQHDPAF